MIEFTSLANGLGDLSNPEKFTSAIELGKTDPKILINELKMMMTIRRAEEKIADGILSGEIVCPCHLAIGQEAIAVGVARHLRSTDRVFGTHRSHGHYLSLGATLHSLFAEVMGKFTGCAKGMGGSMHLISEKNGFYGSVPIVGATISMAVGAGLAAQMDKPKRQDMDVGVTYFGDGAAEEGVLHESMNFASKFRVPVIFICENNLFSSHLHILLRQPENRVARYAEAHDMNVEVVDGNDVEAVAQAAQRLLQAARNGKGPGFLEAVTYRWRGHVGPSEDNDVGLKRSDELQKWKKRDPVRRLEEALVNYKILTAAQVAGLKTEINAHVESAWAQAEKDPYPAAEFLYKNVYKEGEHGCN